MSRKNKIRAELKLIAQFIRQLPVELPLKQPLTDEQQEEWDNLKTHYALVADCWKARALGEDNPLIRYLPTKEIDKWHCEYFWTMAEQQLRLWEMIQLIEAHVRKEFIQLVKEDPKTRQAGVEYPFNSDIELFMRILYDHALHDSIVCLKPYHEVSYPKMTKAIKLAGKALDTKLSATEFTKLKSLYKSQVIDAPGLWFWFDLVLSVSKQEAIISRPIRDKLAAFDLALDQVGKMRLTAHRKRDSDTWNKQHSFAWQNGRKSPASKGGAYSFNITSHL